MITALNGRMPAAMLTVADAGANGPQRLRVDAAASWARMLAAGMPHGCLRSGYRTLAQQSAQDPRLALPAGQSEHGEGIAADVDEPARSWIAAHGLDYGWRIGFVPGEPWHAQYDRTDQHLNDPTATTTLAPPKPRETTMRVIKGADRPDCAITDGATKRHLIQDGGEFADWLRLCDQTEPDLIGQWTYDRIPDWTPTGTVDTAAIVTAVVAALPQAGATAAQVADELAKRLAQ